MSRILRGHVWFEVNVVNYRCTVVTLQAAGADDEVRAGFTERFGSPDQARAPTVAQLAATARMLVRSLMARAAVVHRGTMDRRRLVGAIVRGKLDLFAA